MNTLLTSLLPFVLFAVLLFVFIYLFKIAKKQLSLKITHWLIIAYVGVLLLAAAIQPFINDHTLVLADVSLVNEDRSRNEIYTKLSEGQYSQLDPTYLIKEFQFAPYESKTLNLKNEGNNGLHLYIERTDTDDQNILAYVYSTGLFVAGYTFSDLLLPYKIVLTDETLAISPPEKQIIDLSIRKPSFVSNQFTNKETLLQTISSGEQIIFIKIPEKIEIILDDDIYAEYIQ